MLKLKIVIINSLLLLLILNTSQALAISGKEIKELIKDDLPTFDLPINAYSGKSIFGQDL